MTGHSIPAPDLSMTGEPSDWTVDAALAGIPGGKPAADPQTPVPFFHFLERLKTTKREGWRRFGFQSGESISDHMYRMAIITMFAPKSLADRLNIQHCTKMALVHDMAESLVGDITPVDGVPKFEKARRESTTMDFLTSGLLGQVEGGQTGAEIRAIWQEYEDNQTLEAKFVHDVDKVELLLQMIEYEKATAGVVDLGEFSHVAARIELPEVKAWSEEVLKERQTFWANLRDTK